MTAGRYTPLHSSIWSDPDFINLEREAQHLYLLIISQPDVTYAGVTSYTPKRWARMSKGATPVEVEHALGLLEEARFVFVDDFTEEVMVRTFVEHNKVYEQKQLRNALKRAYAGILSTTLKRLFFEEQCQDVKDLVGRPPAACSEPPQEPVASPAPRPSEASGLSDLDLNPIMNQEGSQSPPSLAGLLLPQSKQDLAPELDDIVMALSDVHGNVEVGRAVQQLVDDRRRFPYPSDARKALESILGAAAKVHPLDGQAKAARAMADAADAERAAREHNPELAKANAERIAAIRAARLAGKEAS